MQPRPFALSRLGQQLRRPEALAFCKTLARQAVDVFEFTSLPNPSFENEHTNRLPADCFKPSLMASTGQAPPSNPNSVPPPTPQTFDKIPDQNSNTGLRESATAAAQKDNASASANNASAGNNISVFHGLLRRGHDGSQKCKLPLEKVFSIQLGQEVFRLSGASIASDAPSYFSTFFEQQLEQSENNRTTRTLYIDRDPDVFRDICRHLQGYHVHPRDGTEFVRLYADAQFYSLPRLIAQLFESEFCCQIGDRNFQISKDVFSAPGDSPNFFSLGFSMIFATPSDVFPGLDKNGLLRPPSMIPPGIPGRSAEVFAQILHLLRGYPIHIKNEAHRAQLLRDCRYLHLRGAEQKLIPHDISYNPERGRSEIVIRLEDIRQSGVQFVADRLSPLDDVAPSGWVHYARPFVDDNAYELIVEIGGQSVVIDLESQRADFRGLAKARVSSLVQVIANKLNLPNKAPLGLMIMSGGASKAAASPGHSPLSEDRPKVTIGSDADVVVDGEPDYNITHSSGTGSAASSTTTTTAMGRPAKRRRESESSGPAQWMVHKGQWRLRIQPDVSTGQLEIIFTAVKLEVSTTQRARNQKRGFLSE